MSEELDPSEAKERMLLGQLSKRGITSASVLRAMRQVPRERFVNADYIDQAYSDRALPIDCRQTISQPYIVALMTQALDLHGSEKVLEIGTGSGYQAAVLGELAGQVVSIERFQELTQRAARVLEELGCNNIKLITGDGTLGYPPLAPYDRIIVTAGALQCPPALFDQVIEGGCIVIPVGDTTGQYLRKISKIQGAPHVQHLTPCRFVPLIGQQGWSEEDFP